MPSSHALVATFIGVAWAYTMGLSLASACVLLASAVVGVLRVVCGFHSWGQVNVGFFLGSALSVLWMEAGRASVLRADAPAFVRPAAYALYVLLSALFLARSAAKGLSRRRRKVEAPAPRENTSV